MRPTTPGVAVVLVDRRRSQTEELIAPTTVRWLAELPPNARPRRLPIEFARIANALSRHWSTRPACLAYFDDLLIDKRGNRRGFPLDVVLELAALKSYFETVLYPAPQTVWEEISVRRRDP
jgi:hypothetical protein